MATFVITRRQEAADIIWILVSTEGNYLVQSLLSFGTEEEASTDIKKVKKAANTRTKVVYRDTRDDTEDVLI